MWHARHPPLRMDRCASVQPQGERSMIGPCHGTRARSFTSHPGCADHSKQQLTCNPVHMQQTDRRQTQANTGHCARTVQQRSRQPLAAEPFWFKVFVSSWQWHRRTCNEPAMQREGIRNTSTCICLHRICRRLYAMISSPYPA